MENKIKTETKRINGYLKEITTYLDSSGNPISQTVNPLMVELKPRDILQIFVGAFLVASPLCFTEEVWKLSIELPNSKFYMLTLVSMAIVSLYVYFNFYRYRLKGNLINYMKRIVATYCITISSVVFILYLIDKLPINESYIALKRVVLIGFPSLFGAVISDNLK